MTAPPHTGLWKRPKLSWRTPWGQAHVEMLTPYPPGIPAALPGERLNRQVLEYLRTGVEAGMVVPDAADQQVGSIRVAIEK
ncbi:MULTISPECIES: hypothetical protein [unclassified Streptomyces]|uniref:Orn/Lys/Arg family decarboxylase n=1 Tax=unclassified Streptomyces TaxID=2593676 RepID=UPI000996B87F|nr:MULTISPECIES: hypothetical protein [unclassified Streptomyces]MYX34776.1 hypothetical protein [Streptomyces sp. SID8377]